MQGSAAQERMGAGGRRRLLTPTSAAGAGFFSLLALVGALTMAVLVPQAAASFSSGVENVAAVAGSIVFGLSFTAVGVVVARRLPRNPMGWLLLAVALSIELGTFAPAYAYLDYGKHHGSLPLGPVAVLLSGIWIFAFMLLPLAILLFPDGQLGRRWRWPAGMYVALGGLFVAVTLKVAVGDLGLRLPVDSGGNLAGLSHPAGFDGAVQGVGLLASLVLAVAAVVRQLLSYRHADSERRQQLKWLTSGAALCVAATVGAVANPPALVSDLIVPAGFAMLPVSIGVGILRCRLYEIDRLVSRTLSYAILTALLAGVFIGLIALSTNTLAISSRVGVAASTLAAAALFNPLRRRIQHLVDRRFNRARYDADATVAAFSTRLRDAVEIDAIRADLLDAVNRAVEPAHASVWIKP
jgi:hypothetical protein